jgi:hypothetical protein
MAKEYYCDKRKETNEIQKDKKAAAGGKEESCAKE